MDAIAEATAHTRAIRTEAHPNCPLCGASGEVLYEGLRDRLFDVPGTWGFRRCTDTACRHVWLDPRPTDADLPLVYENYYTHAGHENTRWQAASRRSVTRTLRLPLKLAYAVFLRLSGLSSARREADAMYLSDRTPGRLLEIGCGSGERLARFAGQGWHVVGQDIDSKAVDRARKTCGVHVHLGPVKDLPGSLGVFDAVVMNHVIEHVSSPTELLRQAAARLAPGGILVAVTPNIESLGHRWFKNNWYALDPPRHLHLFAPGTLAHIAADADLQSVRVTTSAAKAEGIGVGSWSIAHYGRHVWELPTGFRANVAGKFFQACALLRHPLNLESGEECVLLARRQTDVRRSADTLVTEKT